MAGLNEQLKKMAQAAQAAARSSLSISSETKDKVLVEMAEALRAKRKALVAANRIDVRRAQRKGLGRALVDRLTLDEKRIAAMSDSLRDIAALPDPVGEVIKAWRRPNGLWIHKVRVPIGVIAIIYEARPNVTSDCAGLCFKSGNGVILRGGSEAVNSNAAVYETIRSVLEENGLDTALINFVASTDRAGVDRLLKLNGYIDLVMPRGGEGLIRKVVSVSRIPVIKHYKGICHVYVDEWADLNMAQAICFNAKVQRPGVCNAMESMLVNRDCAVRFLPGMLKKFHEAGVEIRGCALTRKIAKNVPVRRATERDYRTEYLDLVLSVKVVGSVEEAVEHVNTYGTHHSDTIVTENYDRALMFLRQVDSACVYVNASTRFTDGEQFGMGAEIGISTDKLHARGPMALEELTTYKYMIFGNGQIRT
ncbi:MAG: glutamate-5-semialdehyde dehydrogenase [Candidatus Omnitrophica bacterium]|nr:glutamate-5-semialdehyde dehydrogenase [Candidatus Omnitrophota bacterium]